MSFAGALLAPALISGQQPDTTGARTHVVRRGETLWSLAREYLGNPRRWREIIDFNHGLIPSADSLPVGASIRLPPRSAGRSSQAIPPAPRPAPRQGARQAAPPARATNVPPRVAAPVPAAAAPARPASGITPAPASSDTTRAPGLPAPAGRTIFFGSQPGGGLLVTAATGKSPTVARADTGAAGAPPTAPNPNEVISAAYIADAADFRRAGRIAVVRDNRVERMGDGGAPVRLTDAVGFVPPAGSRVDSGGRVVTTRVGPTVSGAGVVLIPTGVILATGRPDAAGVRPGRVIAQFDAIAASDLVLPYPSPAAASRDSLVPVARGVRGRVVWIRGDALLPSLQHLIIVNIGARDGVRPGDQLTVRDGGSGAVTDFAEARVLRAGAHDASAIIVRESQPRVRVGMEVVVRAKLP